MLTYLRSLVWRTRFHLHLAALASCWLLVGTAGALADINDSSKQLPAFKTSVPAREYATGAHVGVFGGGNIAQDGDLEGTLGPITLNGKTQNQLGGVAGLRAGYTWPSWGGGMSASEPVGDTFAVLPVLEYEFFWTGYKYKAKGSYAGTDFNFSSDLNVYVFSFDPTVRFQLGMFRPYIGAGIGGAYVTASNPTLSTNLGTGNLSETDDTFCLALQGLAGVEIFVEKNWAVTLDYKYLSLINPEFGSVNSDAVGQHIVTAGINFYF